MQSTQPAQTFSWLGTAAADIPEETIFSWWFA
jgi:hypothetical protein